MAYRSLNIEVGIEGLPAQQSYAWADILAVPWDAFFQFAVGEATTMGAASQGIREQAGEYRTLNERRQ
jgi:hypothetical protein